MASISEESIRKALKDVAPLIRRSVKINPEEDYLELGLRSFGKGTFHKPAIHGNELNGKRLFQIEPGDLLFSNVSLGKTLLAVAQPEDAGSMAHTFYQSKGHRRCCLSRFSLLLLSLHQRELISLEKPRLGAQVESHSRFKNVG